MQRSAWNDIVSWQTRRLNNSTKYLLYASMTTTSKKKWNLLENCHLYDLKLFKNAYIWHELDDLIFYGQEISLHDPSQNGPRLVTNDYLVWYLTFITHVNTINIVLWVILQNNADWTVSRFRFCGDLEDPISTSGGRCAFLEVIHLFQ